MALQEFLEKMQRGGYRYWEYVQHQFGVKSPKNLQFDRCEYLGGGSAPVVISEQLTTTNTTEHPAGDMVGHGISVSQSNGFKYYCTEHGFIMGILSILPKEQYMPHGIDRMWSRKDRLDFYHPVFANLGEQAILNKEIYVDPLSATPQNNNDTWGYTGRWNEYKTARNTVHGDFKKTSFDHWHMGQAWQNRPTLSESFIESDPKTSIFAVDNGSDYLWIRLYHKNHARRPMPFFSIPSL